MRGDFGGQQGGMSWRPQRNFKGKGGQAGGKPSRRSGDDDWDFVEHRNSGKGGGNSGYHDQTYSQWEDGRRGQHRWPTTPSNEGHGQGMQPQGNQYGGMPQHTIPPPPPPVSMSPASDRMPPPGWRQDGRAQGHAGGQGTAPFVNGGCMPVMQHQQGGFGKGQMRSDGAGGGRHPMAQSGPPHHQHPQVAHQYQQRQGQQQAMQVYPQESEMVSDSNPLLMRLSESCKAGDVAAALTVMIPILKGEVANFSSQVLIRALEDMDMCLRQAVLAERDHVNSAIRCQALADIAFYIGKAQLQGYPQAIEILNSVSVLTKARAEQFTPAIISSLVWGFACLSVPNDELMSLAAAEIVTKISGFDHRQLSSTAWAFAKCGLWNSQLASVIAEECKEQISSFTPQSLSNVAWAMAQWGNAEAGLMNAIAKEVISKRDNFDPPSLAMTAWAYAMLQIKVDSLMQCIAEESAKRMGHFKKQDLAHLAWAFASLRVQDNNTLEMLTEEVKKNVRGTQPPELANMAWAFSKMSTASSDIMQMLADEAVLQIGRFKTTEITMVTWAYAVVGQQHHALMSKIGDKVAQRIDRFSPAQIAHVSWAFGALSMRHGAFLNRISQYTRQDIRAIGAQGLTHIVWTFAKVWYRDATFMQIAASVIAEGLQHVKPMALSRAAWAYTVLLVPAEELMEEILADSLQHSNGLPLKVLSLLSLFFISGRSSARQEEVRILMDKHYKQAAEQLACLFPNFDSLSGGANKEALEAMKASGFTDFKLVGTPRVLNKLGFHMPPYSFVARAFKKAAAAAKDRKCEDILAVELQAKIVKDDADEDTIDQLHVMKFTAAKEMAEAEHESFQELYRLFTPDILPCGLETEALQKVLTLCSASIVKKGINLSVEAETQTVHGTLRILVTEVPAVGSLVMLLQLRACFPKVKIEVVEMQTTSTS